MGRYVLAQEVWKMWWLLEGEKGWGSLVFMCDFWCVSDAISGVFSGVTRRFVILETSFVIPDTFVFQH